MPTVYGRLKALQITLPDVPVPVVAGYDAAFGPFVRAWRLGQSLPEDPLRALRESGYVDRISRERAAKNASISTTYA